jgi:hypothetical protein
MNLLTDKPAWLKGFVHCVAVYRMVCLPWAGGNSTIFVGWDLPDVEIVAVELPGRQGWVENGASSRGVSVEVDAWYQ